jgi:hypothetical protein
MEDSLARLGAEMRRLRLTAGMTQAELAALLPGYDLESMRSIISKCERGRAAPSTVVIGLLDEVLDAGGVLVALLRDVRARGLHVRALRLQLVGSAEIAGPDGAHWPREATNEMDQDRREFGLTLAAIVALAGEVSDEIATADPTPRRLEQMEADADKLRDDLYTVPAKVLVQQAATQWHSAHLALARPVSTPVRSRLLVLAGTLACRAASLGRVRGDLTVMRQFGVLAGQYADESGDPLLIGQVAALRSRAAFSSGQFAKAAALAGAGQAAAHPGQRARLAAYHAEALGAAGRGGEAYAALDEMRLQSRRAVHWTPGDQIIFAAATHSALGEHGPATQLAQAYIDGGDHDSEGIGWGHAAIGRALVVGDRPDPAAAAHHGALALAATPDADFTVIGRVSDLHADLRRVAPRAGEIVELGLALDAARATLAS